MKSDHTPVTYGPGVLDSKQGHGDGSCVPFIYLPMNSVVRNGNYQSIKDRDTGTGVASHSSICQ